MSRQLQAIDNVTIDRYFRGYPQWGGVYSNDEFYNNVPYDTRKLYVLNLQNENQPGSHWVLLSCLNRYLVYIDPFGFPPTKGITDWAVASGRPVKFNRYDIQALRSDACGYFAIFIGSLLLSGAPESKVMSLFRDPEYNERLLDKVFL